MEICERSPFRIDAVDSALEDDELELLEEVEDCDFQPEDEEAPPEPASPSHTGGRATASGAAGAPFGLAFPRARFGFGTTAPPSESPISMLPSDPSCNRLVA